MVEKADERYVVDEKGQRIAVILPLEEYEKLQEDLCDLAVVAERRDEKTISLDQMKNGSDPLKNAPVHYFRKNRCRKGYEIDPT